MDFSRAFDTVPYLIIRCECLRNTHTLHAFNAVIKYAYDTYLLVGYNHIAKATVEFANISVWAAKKNLRLNLLKTRELVITNGRHKRNHRPWAYGSSGGAGYSSLRVFGVVLQPNLSVYVDYVLSSCASSTYALISIFRSHGLTSHDLHSHATLCLFRMVGLQDKKRFEGMVRRMIRFGFLADDAPTFASLVSAVDQRLFQSATTNPCHLLRRYLLNITHTGYNLRPRAHDYELPEKDDHSFIKRILYSNIYCKKT